MSYWCSESVFQTFFFDYYQSILCHNPIYITHVYIYVCLYNMHVCEYVSETEIL